jgi:hypothetical protein
MPSFKFSPMKWFAVLFIIVCVLSIALPPDPQTLKNFHLTSTSYHFVIILLLLPEALLWYAIFYTYSKLLEYSRFLKGSKEDKAFNLISLGMGVLAYGLIIPSIISPILNFVVSHHEGFRAAATIINHYMTLMVSVVSFSILRTGSHNLIGSDGKAKRGSLWSMRTLILSFIVLAVIYSYTTIHIRRTGGNPYYLGLIPLMFTIIIPYLYAWFEGLACAYNFMLYSKNIKGFLYKKAFFQLSIGLAITIAGFIFIQFITSTLGVNTNKTLDYILVLIYILLGVLIIGLGIMALGAKKLKKIEEV